MLPGERTDSVNPESITEANRFISDHPNGNSVPIGELTSWPLKIAFPDFLAAGRNRSGIYRVRHRPIDIAQFPFAGR